MAEWPKEMVKGFKRSFVIPARSISPIEIRLMRDSLAVNLVWLLLLDAKVPHPESAVVRDGLPDDDYGEGNADWETGALTDNVVATYINGALANNKYAGFYGIAAQDANPVVDVVIFRVGAGGGVPRGRFQIEPLYAEQEAVGYWPEPIVYHPTETVFIEVEPRDTKAAPGDNLVLMSLVGEAKGPFVG